MKKYESPIIMEAEDLMEGVYAASGDAGSNPPGGGDNPPGGGDYEGGGGSYGGDGGDPRWSLVLKQWDHHNTGSLSVLRIKLVNTDGSKTQNLSCVITFGLPVISWGNVNGSGGGWDVQRISDYAIQVTHYANYINSMNEVMISFDSMKFQHDGTETDQSGNPLYAYRKPVQGESGPYPAGTDFFVYWTCSNL